MHLHLSANCEKEGRECRQTDILFPIEIPLDDPVFRPGTCLPLVRSRAATNLLEWPYREQLNAITSFIDASNVYGSTESTASNLRQYVGGLLKVQSNGLLPTTGDEPGNSEREACKIPGKCFLAGKPCNVYE